LTGRKRWAFAPRILAVLLFATALLTSAVAPARAGEMLVDLLDVGQGDAELIRAGGKVVLIDAGIKRARVVDQLRALGVDHIDLAITTHPHADHIGGMEDVIRGLPVALYIDNGLPHTTQTYAKLMIAVEERDVPYRAAHTGMDIRLGDEAVLHLLLPGDTPLSGTRSDLNSNSVVALLSHGDVDVLLTGDAEAPTERLMARMDLPDIEVLKVPHHGSHYSNTAPFRRAGSADYAIISVGLDNRYGHPDEEAMARIADAGSLIFRTDLSGHIQAVSDGHTVEILELGNLTGVTPPPPAFHGRLSDISHGPGSQAALPRHDDDQNDMAVPKAPAPPSTPPVAAVAPPPPDGPNLSGLRNPPPAAEPLTRRARRARRRAQRRNQETP